MSIDQQLLQFFEAEVRNLLFSDEDARAEFFLLTQAATTETRVAAFNVLKKYRPVVADKLFKEVTKEFWGEQPKWVRQIS